MMSSIRRSLGVIAGASALILVTGSFYSEAQEPGNSKAVLPKTAKKAVIKKEAAKKVVAPVVEEEDEPPVHKTAAKKKNDPRRRLYPYFAQLGLTDAQKNSIYDIRSKHAPKVDALEKQLDDTRAQAMAEAEKVLTPAQRKLLEERRKSAHAAAEMKGEASKVESETTPAKRNRNR